jgi:hypothetical protein
LAERSPRELLRLAGRVLVWALLVLLLVRGTADVLADDARPARVDRSARPVAVWPDERARAFAAGFARAYMSFSPKRRAQYVRGLSRFMAPELVAGAAPQFAGEQLVVHAAAAGSTSLGPDRALITVAVGVSGSPSVQHLAVPVSRDERGGLVVDELPSLVPGPPKARPEWPVSAPLTGPDRDAIEDVAVRFFRAYLAGDAAGLEYLVPAAVRIAPVSPPLALVDVDSIAELGEERAGDDRLVMVTVRARDPRSAVVYRLRYRVALVRADRWYVAAVNESPKEG